MTAIIYVLKDPISNEIRYVGCTKNELQRNKAHNNIARDIGTVKREWIESLRKLRLKPIFEKLEDVEDTIAIIREKEIIKEFRQLGYNLTNTGDIVSNGNSTSFKQGENSKPIIAISLFGDYFNSYVDAKTASKELNISYNNINAVLFGRTRTAGNLIWLYEEQYYSFSEEKITNLIKEANNNKTKGGIHTKFKKGETSWNKGLSIATKPIFPIFQYDINTGNFIKEWVSAKEVSIELSCSEQAITGCCRKQNKSSMGFIWRYYYKDIIKLPTYNNPNHYNIKNKIKP